MNRNYSFSYEVNHLYRFLKSLLLRLTIPDFLIDGQIEYSILSHVYHLIARTISHEFIVRILLHVHHLIARTLHMFVISLFAFSHMFIIILLVFFHTFLIFRSRSLEQREISWTDFAPNKRSKRGNSSFDHSCSVV